MFGAVLGAIGGVAQLGINYAAQKYAADKQYQAQIETNKANAELAAQQNEWNIEQWNRNNAYNTAAAQSARYQQAGINPSLAMQAGQMSAGNSSAPAQQAPLPHMEAPEVRAPQLDLSPILQNIMTAKQMQKEDKEIEARELDNTLARMTLFDRAHEIKSKARSSDHRALIDGLLEDFTRRTQDSRIKQVITDSKIRDEEFKKAQSDALKALHEEGIAEIKFMNAPQAFNVAMAEAAMRIWNLKQQGKYSKAAAKQALASAFLSNTQAMQLPDFSPEQRKEYAGYVLDGMDKNNQLLGKQLEAGGNDLVYYLQPEVYNSLTEDQQDLIDHLVWQAKWLPGFNSGISFGGSVTDPFKGSTSETTTETHRKGKKGSIAKRVVRKVVTRGR